MSHSISETIDRLVVDLNINLNVNLVPGGLASEIIESLTGLKLQGSEMAKTLADVISEMERQTTIVSGVKTLVLGLRDQVAGIGGLTAAQQEQVNSIFDAASANDKALGDVLISGTPADTNVGSAGTDSTVGSGGVDTVGGNVADNAVVSPQANGSTGQVDPSTGKLPAGALQPGNPIQ